MRSSLLIVLVLSLLGCASSPVPKDVFYRFARPQPKPETLAIQGPVVVEALQADGLHSERALLYSEDPEHRTLTQFNYHFWSEAPPRLIQEYLVAWLRATSSGRLRVTEADGRGEPHFVISGRLKALDLWVDADGRRAVVAMELRLRPADEFRYLLIRDYRQEKRLPDTGMAVAVAGFEEGVSTIFREFVRDANEVLEAEGN